MTKLILLAGEPGTGKSSLIKALLPPSKSEKVLGLLRGHIVNDVFFAGLYDSEKTYSGTDLLSMAVQPHFLTFLKRAAENGAPRVIVSEGDRLSNPSLIQEAAKIPGVQLQIFVLKVSDAALSTRRKNRGDTFSDVWLRGRKTKVRNFAKEAESIGKLTFLKNETEADQKENLEMLSALIFN